MTTPLPSWRTACIPHRDIREDAVSEALFAVNLSRAIVGLAQAVQFITQLSSGGSSPLA